MYGLTRKFALCANICKPRPAKSWPDISLPRAEDIPAIDLEVVNYHVAVSQLPEPFLTTDIFPAARYVSFEVCCV